MNTELENIPSQPAPVPFDKRAPRDVDQIISIILRIGVLTSAAIIIVGLVLFLSTGDGGYPDDQFPTRLSDMFSGLAAGKSMAIILVGLFCLILTPIMRVGVSIIVFVLEKDYLYVMIACAVFVILILSMFLGIHG